jgi:hypothetical protein
VVGIDIHPEYVRRTRERFGRRLAGIELFVGDALADEIAFSPVQLVFAGLFFEYVDPCAALNRIRQAMLIPGGTLVSVVQLASSAIPEVTPSAYTRLGGLSAVMRLVAPDRLAEMAADNDFRPLEDRTVVAGGGKRFRLQSFRLAAGSLAVVGSRVDTGYNCFIFVRFLGLFAAAGLTGQNSLAYKSTPFR